MSQRPDATPEVARARRYAARVRILIALAGGLLLSLEPELAVHLWPAAIGFAVIGVTGLVEWYVHDERWLRVEEALSCVAVICMVGLSGGRVNVVSVLWLVAAAAGVLARGGRVGGVGRVVVVGVLLSPLVIESERSLESVGFAVGAIALFLATGRISRETTELLRRARHDAAHDPLTGLLSRTAFRAQVDALAALATPERPAALIGFDLDDFGAVNKRFGHAAGDRVLVAAARRMETELRDEDVLGRLGGDEFAALVFCDDPTPVAERLIEAIAGDGELGSSARAGFATCPRDGATAEALLAAADVALRLAKRSGDTVRGYQGAPIASEDEDGARAALERLCRGEGLAVATQPIVDLETGRVARLRGAGALRHARRAGAAALVRAGRRARPARRARAGLPARRTSLDRRAAAGQPPEREPLGHDARRRAHLGGAREPARPQPPDHRGDRGDARAPQRRDRAHPGRAGRARRALRRGRRGRRLLGARAAGHATARPT